MVRRYLYIKLAQRKLRPSSVSNDSRYAEVIQYWSLAWNITKGYLYISETGSGWLGECPETKKYFPDWYVSAESLDNFGSRIMICVTI